MQEQATELTAEAVHALVKSCLYKDEEVTGDVPDDAVIVKGIMTSLGFHPQRLETARGSVEALLSQLPEQFMDDAGGGWSFLNACLDKHGRQWGEHPDIEALCLLGIALDLVEWTLPEEMWSILPGGIPYLAVKRTRFTTQGE